MKLELIKKSVVELGAKEVFKEYFRKVVDEYEAGFRKFNLDELADKLEEMGYFEAPASTKYHGSYKGGLFMHSWVLTDVLYELTEKNNLEWTYESSPFVIGMLHDLCKYDQYIWSDEKCCFYWNKEQEITGHGDKSLILIADKLGINLSEEEKMCIRWHMGAFDEKENWRLYTNAVNNFENVLWVHHADMMASNVYNT